MLQLWEYQIIEQARGIKPVSLSDRWSNWEPEIDYDALGQKGWELVSVVPIADSSATKKLRHYFKRMV